MRKISTLRKAGFAGLALGVGALCVPMLGGNAYADDECVGPTTSSQLRDAIQAQNPGTVTLCDNISTGGGASTNRTVTINLNGKTLTKTGGGNVLSTYGQGKITIVGTGNVNGNLSGSFTLQGGTYNRNPSSSYVKSPYAVYRLAQNSYIVDKDISTFAVNPTTKAVRVANSFQINNNLQELGSTSGVTYASADETIATVSDTGEVKGVANGETTITVTPTYSAALAKTVSVSVYDIVADPEGDEAAGVAASTLKEVIDNGGLPKDPKEKSEATDAAKEVLGSGSEYRHAHEALRTAMGNGEKITTSVNVDDEYVPTEDEVALVESALTEAGYGLENEISYFNVSVRALDSEGLPLASLHQLNNRIFVALMTTEEPDEGYVRHYVVVAIHNGEPVVLTEGEDYYVEDGVLYLVYDKFSTFAVTYEDTLIPEETSKFVVTSTSVKAPVTGGNTAESTGAATSSAIALVAGAIAMATMGGAVVFAKRK